MCEGEAASDSGVPTPKGGWGETGWTEGGRTRSAAPRRTGWTASGASDWGFPRSGEGGGGRKIWEERKQKGAEGGRGDGYCG